MLEYWFLSVIFILGSAALWAFPLSSFDLVLLESPSLRACVNPGSQQRQPRLVQHAHRRTLGATLRVLTLNVPRCLPQLTSCRSPMRRRARSSPHASLSLTAMTSHNRVWCACIASTERSFSPSVKQLLNCYCCTVRKIHAVMFPYEYALVLICTVLPIFVCIFCTCAAFALLFTYINCCYWMKVILNFTFSVWFT